MNRLISVAVIAVVSTIGSSADAQGRRLAIEASIGLVPPTGVFADRYEAGGHAAVGVEPRNPGSRVGWRVEGSWDDFSPKYGGRDNHARAGSLTANGILTLTPPAFTAVALYAIGGVGYYNTSESALFHGTQSDIGFNGGGGLRLRMGAVWLYLEGRLHDIPVAQMYFVPLTLGVAF